MSQQVRPKSVLRGHVPRTCYDQINKRTCLHVDAWLYQLPDDSLYFLFEYRAGGHDIISRQVFRAVDCELVQVSAELDLASIGVARTVGGPWDRRAAPYLAALHWRVIYPTLRAPREGFKGHVSVSLHYVYRALGVPDDPCEGLDNLYAVTLRPGRKAAAGRGDQPGAPTVPAQWGRRERSVLRTLGKLLR